MPESRIAIGHRRPIKFAVKSAYGFATDTSKLSPPVDPGPRRGQGYASGILDTWNRANLQMGVQLMPSADFQNYYSTASAPTQCLFSFPDVSLSPCLNLFPSSSIFLRLSCQLPFFQPSFLHNWNRCSRAISTSVSTGRK